MHHEVTKDDWLWLIGSLAQVHGIAFDTALLQRDFPPPLDVAALIRAGEEVVVTDHATDEDLTAVVLTQIIFEQEKAQRGFLPKSVLTNLVRAGGDTLGTLRRGLTLPLDLWRHVDEEIDRRVQTLISKGDLAKEEGQRLREKLLSPMFSTPEMPGLSDLEQLLTKHGVPTREELARLHAQIDALSAKLESLNREKAGESENQ